MSTTEAPFVVSHNFCAIRANTVPELEDRLVEFTESEDMPALIAEFRAAVSRAVPTPSLQGVSTGGSTAPTTAAEAEANLNAGGIATTPVGGGIEERMDRWGNRYVSGEPTGQSCAHGPRIVAYKKSKAGKQYKAYVCVNDSPFGNYQNGKCDQVYPER